MRLSLNRMYVSVAFAALAVIGLSGCETGEETVAKLAMQAEKGDVGAMLKIAEIYCGGINIEQDDQVCSIWMRRAAEGGHKRAQFMLGGMYEQGLGVRADPVQAFRWYTHAFEQGYQMSGSAAKKLEATMMPAQLARAKELIEEGRKAKETTGRYFVATGR